MFLTQSFIKNKVKINVRARRKLDASSALAITKHWRSNPVLYENPSQGIKFFSFFLFGASKLCQKYK